MLHEREMKAIRLYYEGRMNVEDIAKECGWENRSSIYKLLKREEAQEYRKMLEQETIKESLTMLRMNSRRLTKKLLDVADGNIKNEKTIYAELNATNSGLEKAGLTAKNTIILEDGNKSNDEDYNELIDMLQQKKEKE